MATMPDDNSQAGDVDVSILESVAKDHIIDDKSLTNFSNFITHVMYWNRYITDRKIHVDWKNHKMINGKQDPIKLSYIYYIPQMLQKMFSITRAMKNGFKLTSDDKSMTLIKGKQKIWFDADYGGKEGVFLLMSKSEP